MSVIFHKFVTEIWPLINFRLSFTLYLDEKIGIICVCFNIDKLKVGISMHAILQIGSSVMALDVDLDFYVHLAI